ncbi:alpha carbonic anhydrase [Gorgonomyces haynaldii]|nr:alpha carbonic anhydrase [Gorgonomyces haynaldii]
MLFLVPVLVSSHPNCLADVIAPQATALLQKRGLEFGYEGQLGDKFWGDLDPSYVTCKAGKHQSPINFGGHELGAFVSKEPHQLRWAREVRNGNFTHNGHTIQVNVPADSGFTLSTGGKDGYVLKQFHFHTPSEHHLEERAYDMEAHFVHVNAENQIAVFGVWFEVSDRPSRFLDSVLSSGVPKKGEPVNIRRIDFDALKRELANVEEYFSYSGSLTTPPCTEGVQWTVANIRLPFSMRQKRILQDAMPYNARTTMSGAPVETEEKPPAEKQATYEEKPSYGYQKPSYREETPDYGEYGYDQPPWCKHHVKHPRRSHNGQLYGYEKGHVCLVRGY